MLNMRFQEIFLEPVSIWLSQDQIERDQGQRNKVSIKADGEQRAEAH